MAKKEKASYEDMMKEAAEQPTPEVKQVAQPVSVQATPVQGNFKPRLTGKPKSAKKNATIVSLVNGKPITMNAKAADLLVKSRPKEFRYQ